MRQPRVAIFSLLNASIRRARKLAILFSSLAFFLCYGEGVSYGGVHAVSSYYPAFGAAVDTVVTNTGDILVSLSQQSSEGLTGIQVFSPASGYMNPCAAAFRPNITNVEGMALFPDGAQQQATQPSVGAAVEQQGAEFFRVGDLDTCAIDAVNVKQKPVKRPNAPGSFALAVTPNGAPEYAFVANEYGIAITDPPHFNLGQRGTIGIIKIQRDSAGKFTKQTKRISRNPYIYIPGADTIPGVTMSHDGKYLYVVDEGTAAGSYKSRKSPYHNNPYSNPTNINNSNLSTQSCVNEYGKPSAGMTRNGVLTVIDVNKAESGMGQKSIIQTIACGCSPVRVVETTDGQYIFVATRGGNPGPGTMPPAGSVGRVLVFNVSNLLSSDLNTVNTGALVNVIDDSGGTQPVGMALFDNDQMLAVANSNRFTAGTTGTTAVAIFDVHDPSTVAGPEVVCPSSNISSFPRGVASDGSTVYVANFGSPTHDVSGSLQVITTESVPGASSCTVGPYPE